MKKGEWKKHEKKNKTLFKWWKKGHGKHETLVKVMKKGDWKHPKRNKTLQLMKKNGKHENYWSKILFKQWEKGNGKHEKGKQNYVQVMKKGEWKTWKQ